MTSPDQIEKIFFKHLQRNLLINGNNKQFKQGKLLLFKVKDFFCVFTLLINGKKITYEVPYPFDIKGFKDDVVLDYTLDTFCTFNNGTEELVNMIRSTKTSKLYNKKIVVHFS